MNISGFYFTLLVIFGLIAIISESPTCDMDVALMLSFLGGVIYFKENK